MNLYRYLKLGGFYIYWYLRQLKNITFYMPNFKDAKKKSIVVVTHDMSYGGAPLLLLYIVKTLKIKGYSIVVVSARPGAMIGDFSKHAKVYISYGSKLFIKRLTWASVDNMVIVNTAIAGNWVKPFKNNNFKVLSLIHELPGAIKDWGAECNFKNSVKYSDVIVFPSSYVLNKHKISDVYLHKIIIRHQGIYLKSDTHYNKEASIEKISRVLPISNNKIVLNVATGNHRKGFDLFVDLAVKDPNLNFIWVGDFDKGILIDKKLEFNLNEIKNLYLPGYIKDKELLHNFYVASDIFVLTSREEPFGSVVLEAMQNKTPVVAFKNAGGFQDVVKNDENGYLINLEDTHLMLNKLQSIAQDDELQNRLASKALKDSKQFGFEEYVDFLINIQSTNNL